MTNKEAINWIINLAVDIGKAENKSLWHYEQALSEIKTLLENHENAINRQRQAIIDAFHKNYDAILDFTSDGKTIANSAEDIISGLPSF